VAYSQTVTASGGTAPYTYAVTTGSLPPGLGLNPITGVISGTPTVPAGTASFTITATGAGGFTGSQAYSITITAPTITLSPASLPGGTGGTAYSQTVTASGGTAPYTYAVTTGSLPPGLGLNAGSGVISGTPTAPAGTANFTITATGVGGFTGSQAYSITIAAPTITVNPASLPGGTGGTAYSQTISATGGTGPYSFAVTSGSLPGGLGLAGGVISGTPTAPAGAFNFTITATDALGFMGSRGYTITITAPTITLSPGSLSGGTVGTAYSASVSAGGGTAPYSFGVTSGSLPPGLGLDGATGAITGTPTTAGTYNFTITATDAGGFTGSQGYSIVIS
jgi:hypothetical protein